MIYVGKQSLSILLSKFVFQCVLVTLLMSKPTISKQTTFTKSKGFANLKKNVSVLLKRYVNIIAQNHNSKPHIYCKIDDVHTNQITLYLYLNHIAVQIMLMQKKN